MMNEQLRAFRRRVPEAFLGFGPPDIDFLPNLKISLNLKKSMSQVYFKHLKVKTERSQIMGDLKVFLMMLL